MEEEMTTRQFYFAGSIRGGRVDAGLYRRMIELMKRYGRVLTEHVGDLSLSVLERGDEGDGAIYRQDTQWILDCDLLVAECTCPSLGVGYELAFAEHHGKPCHIFYDKSRTQLSAMLKGNPYFHVQHYSTEQELMEKLEQLLAADTKNEGL